MKFDDYYYIQDKNVESLVRDVNSHMRQRQEQERLKNIIARIDSYEPIVSAVMAGMEWS